MSAAISVSVAKAKYTPPIALPQTKHGKLVLAFAKVLALAILLNVLLSLILDVGLPHNIWGGVLFGQNYIPIPPGRELSVAVFQYIWIQVLLHFLLPAQLMVFVIAGVSLCLPNCNRNSGLLAMLFSVGSVAGTLLFLILINFSIFRFSSE